MRFPSKQISSSCLYIFANKTIIFWHHTQVYLETYIMLQQIDVTTNCGKEQKMSPLLDASRPSSMSQTHWAKEEATQKGEKHETICCCGDLQTRLIMLNKATKGEEVLGTNTNVYLFLSKTRVDVGLSHGRDSSKKWDYVKGCNL